MAANRIKIDGQLSIHKALWDFVNTQLTPAIGIKPKEFFRDLHQLVKEFGGENDRLLKVRDEMQRQIDEYFERNKGKVFNAEDFQAYLKKIRYIVPEGPD